MGSLFDIGQGADAEIKQKLNNAFSGKNLKNLQKHWKTKEKIFAADHRLEKFCARANLFPTGNYGNDDAKGKWFYLLTTILKKATDGSTDPLTGNPITTTAAINAALTKAMDANHAITRVVFDAQEDSKVAAHHIYPNNGNPGITIGDTLTIILVCPAPLSDDDVANPPAPNDLDPGQQDLPPIEDPLKKKRKKRQVKQGKKSKKSKKKNKR